MSKAFKHIIAAAVMFIMTAGLVSAREKPDRIPNEPARLTGKALVNIAEAGNGVPESAKAEETEDVNANAVIMEHLKDSYEWHFFDTKTKTVAIYLPVIVHSSTGWHCFSSREICEGETVEGLYIAKEGKHEGKIVELNEAGEEKRPFDISITKTVLGLMINSFVTVLIILLVARWYKRHDATEEATTGLAGLLEPITLMMYDDVIRDAIGPEYKKYTPYLLTAFYFILVNNLMGIIPFFPGGANVTGNIAVTLTLAVCTFLAINVTTNKHYWKDIFWGDVPWWLKLPLPLMPTVEIIGMFTKPFALMIRLFANILAGHSLLLGIVCVVFLTAKMGAAMNGSLSAVAVIFGVFVDVIEVLVAFIQAYVFTMLSAVFIGLARPHPKHE